MTALTFPARLAGLQRERLLRLVLKLDAAVTGANGAAYLLAAGPLGDVLGLPSAPLRATGAFLVLYAAAVWVLATRRTVARGAVVAVVAANVLWAIDSVVLAIAGWGSPAAAGTVWILLQAFVVAGLAAVQWRVAPTPRS